MAALGSGIFPGAAGICRVGIVVFRFRESQYMQSIKVRNGPKLFRCLFGFLGGFCKTAHVISGRFCRFVCVPHGLADIAYTGIRQILPLFPGRFAAE